MGIDPIQDYGLLHETTLIPSVVGMIDDVGLYLSFGSLEYFSARQKQGKRMGVGLCYLKMRVCVGRSGKERKKKERGNAVSC